MEGTVPLPGGMTDTEKQEAFQRVAIKDPAHLKRWLVDTDRRWLIFNVVDLVDSLPFPEGVDTLIQLIAIYRDHRRAIPAGQPSGTGGLVTKGELLEPDELDLAIRHLVRRMRELNPSWTL